ncbi:alpha/beta fold hydrolase [Vreelandella populi]|uniref:Alpha/beta hydrolase n=1 Tax=Vreelandella populi TaxID=2498858 RepID=A0A433LEC0_9GAMM|nr:alpha/beta hydrolase [Halomonas populi]RUR35457.1 alpha/beta hydrolase [Halomonas populi]RUR47646.1 alpha/beta hydrolase [Halomonas populi]RUR54489.1 alpha/beta hydrolase [Halomonas populi]
MLTKEQVVARNNVTIVGSGEKTLMLAHGFGCDQQMWRHLIPHLKERYTLVLFDYVGSGQSQISAFSESRYRALEGYAKDVTEICQALNLTQVHLIGHSVSGTIGLLASIAHPELFASQVMICPSPCFLNMPPDYYGGFECADIEELLGLMDRNYIGWANYLAPLVMGLENSELLTSELSDSFCSTDPVVAKAFAKATFFSDYRHLLPQAKHEALLLQSQQDSLASPDVGHYMHAHMPGSTLRLLASEGHCLHMTHPELVAQEINTWLRY